MALDLEDGERAILAGAHRHAFFIFMGLCRNSEDKAFFKVSEMALNGQLLDEEREQMVDLFNQEIRRHNPEATYNLAILYWRVPAMQNLELAESLLRKCCDSGMIEAYLALARLYIGDGANLPEASSDNIMRVLHEAFALGSIEAAWLIARQHMKGEHASRNDFDAFKWLFIAGRLGHEEARKQALIIAGLQHSGALQFVQDEALELLDKLYNRGVEWR
jgi:TPR repeat protein